MHLFPPPTMSCIDATPRAVSLMEVHSPMHSAAARPQRTGIAPIDCAVLSAPRTRGRDMMTTGVTTTTGGGAGFAACAQRSSGGVGAS
jgi:hypothetical protein